MVKSKSLSDRVIVIFCYVMVTFMAIMCLVPIINTVAISLSDPAAVAAGKVSFFPVDFTLAAYKEMMKDQQFFTSFFVSIKRVILGGGLNIILIVLSAYPLSRSPEHFPQKKFYMVFFIFNMLFSGGMIPNFLLVKNLGLIDTMWALILPGAVNITNIILLMNFFKGIPEELNESARIDGASAFTIFTKIYLPLAVPGIATVLLFTIIGHWNAFFDGIIYINSADKLPLQTYIQQLTAVIRDDVILSEAELEQLSKISGKTFNAAKVFVTMVPVLVVYPFLQRYFVTGLVVGSVKG